MILNEVTRRSSWIRRGWEVSVGVETRGRRSLSGVREWAKGFLLERV